MRRMAFIVTIAIAAAAAIVVAQAGPYKVLQRARVGGEGGWDYIYAGPDGRLYIPRGQTRAEPATDSTPAVAAAAERVMVYDLRTLKPVGEIPNVGGHGVAVDPKSHHGFVSGPKVTMFDTKTLKVLKEIDVGDARSDGILFDAYNERVYIFSHPTKNATVIDAKDGKVIGTIDLGGVPEEGVADGHGTLYDIMQDAEGSVAVVNVNTMKTVTHYPLGGPGRCNGLALDDEHHVLFAACATSGAMAQGEAPKAVMVDSEREGREDPGQAAAARRFRRRGVQPGHAGGVRHAGQRLPGGGQGEQPDELHDRADAADDERRAHDHARQHHEPHLHDERRAWAGAGAAAGRRPWSPGARDSRIVHDPDDREVAARRSSSSPWPFDCSRGAGLRPAVRRVAAGLKTCATSAIIGRERAGRALFIRHR